MKIKEYNINIIPYYNKCDNHINDLKLCTCLKKSFYDIVSKFEVTAFLRNMLNLSTSALIDCLSSAEVLILSPFVKTL